MTIDYAGTAPAHSRQFPRLLVIVLLLAAGLRLGWVLRLPADEASFAQLPDQREYLDLGRNLRQGLGLCFVDIRFSDTLYAFRMPGYPALVALCNADVRAIRIVQAMLDTGTVLAGYLLARRWLERGASSFVALLIAANPFLIFFCGLILSETLFTALLVWGMALLVNRPIADLRRRWNLGIAWFAGITLLVLSIHVRPSAIAMPLTLSVVAAFINRHWRLPYDRRWLPPVGTLVLVLTILALVPWALRNHRILGQYIWTTTNSGFTMYDGFNPDATGGSDQSFVQAMPLLKSMDEPGRSEYLGELAWQFIRANPARVAQLAVIKLARTWSPVPLSREFGGDWRKVALAGSYMIPLYVLVVLAVWLGRAGAAIKVYLLMPALYFTVVHVASVGSLRYRVPADVPMAVLAGIGAATVMARRSLDPADEVPTTHAARA